MHKIGAVVRSLHKSGKKALIPYITAGDPDMAKTLDVLDFFAKSGADIIELGVPFSDPVADGPVIQAAMERALSAGASLKKVLDVVRKFRKRHDTPIILMGYLNPFWAYGLARFAADAAKAGVDGVLTVDLPPEEAGSFCEQLDKNGIIPIFLATPVTDAARLSVIGTVARGFIYFVSVTGITGVRTALPEDTGKKIADVRRALSLPVMLGFGISGEDAIRQLRRHADGFVVGSALVTRWHKACISADGRREFEHFFNRLVHACHNG